MNVTLSIIHWQFVLVYLKDIVIHLENPEAHIKHVRHVFALLRNSGLTIKLKKSEFFSNSIKYLSHIIHTGQLKVSQQTVDAMRVLKPQTNIMELYLFLGSCNAFRLFVTRTVCISARLNRKLRKDQLTHFKKISVNDLRAIQTLQQN